MSLNDCDRSNCPFVRDPHNSDRYVCVKCEKNYDFGGNRLFNWMLILLAIAAFVLLNNSPEETDLQPEPQSSSQTLPSKL